jgi:FkbM family methyltransferase
MNIREYIKNHRSEIDDQKNKGFGGHFDKIILDYVSDIDNGFFVEAGANIGQNTGILEECGWKGLLVEPSLSSYRWCLKNRPNCINENYALVSHEYEKETIFGCQNTKIGKTIHLFGYPLMSIDGAQEIPVTTFSSLTKKHNIRNVDVFFLDTEGYELEVLKGINFEECYIKYFVVEVNSEYYSVEELKIFMFERHFELVDILQTGKDYLFKNKTNN